MRRFVDTLIVLGVLALGTQSFLVAGWLAPIVVDSGSMAPNLPGPHRNVVCRSCGLQFACDAVDLPASGRALCPNCWFDQNDLTPLPDLSGDRLIVDRAAWTFSTPRRWQTFVLVDPDDAKSWVVKRIVGLPGEQVEIRDGDVWIDGRRASKTVEALRAMAVLVHDDAHRPSIRTGSSSDDATAPALLGWRPADSHSAWRQADRGWRWQAGAHGPGPDSPAGSPDRFDWLAYHHYQSPASHGGLAAPGPIMDDDAYNQSESRELHPVRDLLVCFRTTMSADVDLAASISDGRDAFEIEWHIAAGECELRRRPAAEQVSADISAEGLSGAVCSAAGDAVQMAPFEAAALRAGATIEFAQCDGRIFVAIDGRLLIDYEYAPGDSARSPDASPVAIGLSGGGAKGAGATIGSALIDELRVLRDVYYLPAAEGVAASTPCWRLGPQEFFLLGDNSPRSVDSRHWPPGAALRGRLAGRVIGVLAAGSR